MCFGGVQIFLGWPVEKMLGVHGGIWIGGGLACLISAAIVWYVKRSGRSRSARDTGTRSVACEVVRLEGNLSPETGSALTQYEIVAQSPDTLSENEFLDFVALTLAGGEVFRRGLERRVRKAEKLVFLRVAGYLAGIGALKRPDLKYRQRVASECGVELRESEYPMEFGWVVVPPNYRGRGYSNMITATAVTVANGVGVFATSGSDNLAMHRILKKHGFIPVGRPYVSWGMHRERRLFVRAASEQGAPAGSRD